MILAQFHCMKLLFVLRNCRLPDLRAAPIFIAKQPRPQPKVQKNPDFSGIIRLAAPAAAPLQ